MTTSTEVNDLQDHIASLAEQLASLRDQLVETGDQLAEYCSVVGEVVKMLGHVGDEPCDLRDAVGQIEALFAGKDSLERNDLAGLAEQVRKVLHGSSFAEESPLASLCGHGVAFDPDAARGMSAQHVRQRWPRLAGPCPLGCDFDGIAYASMEHFVMGDW